MQQNGPPGLNLALARHGEVISEGALGYADLGTKGAMTPQTVSHSGSVGKTFTATAAMQLVEQGGLGIRTPISQDKVEAMIRGTSARCRKRPGQSVGRRRVPRWNRRHA